MAAACDHVAAGVVVVAGDTCTGEETPRYSRPDEQGTCVMLGLER